MNEQHHGNLLGGADGETTQTAAQHATIAASAAQTLARARVRRLAADTARDQATADAERAVLRTEHAATRLRWGLAFERSFSTASAAEAAAVWAATQPWVDHDPTAHEAARGAEERLATLHPELIVSYQQGIAEGLEPVDPMATAATVLAAGDANGARAARALAGDERSQAQEDAAIPTPTSPSPWTSTSKAFIPAPLTQPFPMPPRSAPRCSPVRPIRRPCGFRSLGPPTSRRASPGPCGTSGTTAVVDRLRWPVD